MFSLIMFNYFLVKPCPFWMAVTSRSFGISLLIEDVIDENANSKLCTFGVLQIWYYSQVLIFLMGYRVWSLDLGG